MSDQIEIQDPGEVARQMLAGVPTAAPETPPATSAAPGADAGAAASAEIGVAGSPAIPADAPRDRSGQVFRPEIHRALADGKPFVNKRGYFMPVGKNGGRKPKGF